MTILGISAYFHDSAAAVVQDGQIIAAAQEERFSRIKNDKNFPSKSVQYCLEAAGITIDQLDAVVYYEKSFLKFERLIESYYAYAPAGISSFIKSIPHWLKEKIFIKRNLRNELKKIQSYNAKKLKLLFTEHHLSHAASAYYPSGFDEAAILTIDGVGEFATTTISKGSGNKIEVLKEFHFPHSVGLLYSAFTYYLGFRVNSDEYKLMGLAPYGNPHSEQTQLFCSLIKNNLASIYEDGSIQMNQKFFDYGSGLKMINERRFEKLFGFKTRQPEEEFKQEHLNCAMAIQQVLEEIVSKLTEHTKQITKSKNLCLAGGVALNCVANGKIQSENVFEKIFIQPAAGDAGGAIGAALAGYHIYFDKKLTDLAPEKEDGMNGAYLGPEFSNEYIETIAKKNPDFYKHFSSASALCSEVAQLLADGKIVGWFQGRMEYGPRSLGNRSIFADARNSEMQKKLNLKIKNRESFRPFAPAVLIEDVSNYFEIGTPSPYMLLVQKIKSEYHCSVPEDYDALSWQEKLYTVKSKLPCITHVDFSTRIQTVSGESNPLFYLLLSSFKKLTGYGVLANTSFNIKDEPVVCTPEEALACFKNTEMDCLVLGNYLFKKTKD